MKARLAAALTATVLVAGVAGLGVACIAVGAVLAWALPSRWLLACLWGAGAIGLGGLWWHVYRDARDRARTGDGGVIA